MGDDDSEGQFKMKESIGEMDGGTEIYAEAPDKESCMEMFRELKQGVDQG